MTSIIVDRRYCGPPNSGNDGYVCGRLARHIPGGAEVTPGTERARQFGQDVKTAFGGSAADAAGSGVPSGDASLSALPGSSPAPRTSSNGAWIFGVIMIVLGGLFLLQNLTALRFGQLWPLILILIGGVMLYNQLRK